MLYHLVKTRKVVIKTLDNKDQKGKGKNLNEKDDTTSSEEDSSSTEDSSDEDSSD